MPSSRRLFPALLVLVTGCGRTPSPAPGGEVLAVVDGEIVTEKDLAALPVVLAWEAQDSIAPRPPWPSEGTPGAGGPPRMSNAEVAGRADLVARLVDQILVEKAARERGLVADGSQVEAAVTRFLSSPGGASPAPDGEVIRRLIALEMTAARYWKTTVTDLIQVSDLDMTRFLEKNPGTLPTGVDPTRYVELRPRLEPIMARLEERAAVEARLRRLHRQAQIRTTPEFSPLLDD